MSTAVPRDRRTVEGVWVTMILLLTVSACGGTDSRHPERTSADNAQWAVVQEYLDEPNAWVERIRAAAPEGGGPPSMQERPSVVRAVATARATLNAEGVHEKTVEAAEFLVDHAWDVPRGDWHGAVGARASATHAPPDYERWPRVLAALDGFIGGS